MDTCPNCGEEAVVIIGTAYDGNGDDLGTTYECRECLFSFTIFAEEDDDAE